MAIRVKCPNGHVLTVKDKFAGRTGYCPVCKAKVQVPAAEKPMSEDEIAKMMDRPSGGVPAKLPSEEYVHQEPRHDEAEGESGISLLGSSLARRNKICPQCGDITSFSFTECPRCGTPLAVHSERPPEAGLP